MNFLSLHLLKRRLPETSPVESKRGKWTIIQCEKSIQISIRDDSVTIRFFLWSLLIGVYTSQMSLYSFFLILDLTCLSFGGHVGHSLPISLRK